MPTELRISSMTMTDDSPQAAWIAWGEYHLLLRGTQETSIEPLWKWGGMLFTAIIGLVGISLTLARCLPLQVQDIVALLLLSVLVIAFCVLFVRAAYCIWQARRDSQPYQELRRRIEGRLAGTQPERFSQRAGEIAGAYDWYENEIRKGTHPLILHKDHTVTGCLGKKKRGYRWELHDRELVIIWLKGSNVFGTVIQEGTFEGMHNGKVVRIVHRRQENEVRESAPST